MKAKFRVSGNSVMVDIFHKDRELYTPLFVIEKESLKGFEVWSVHDLSYIKENRRLYSDEQSVLNYLKSFSWFDSQDFLALEVCLKDVKNGENNE